MASPAVGIDLGTTNSVVAVSLQGKPQVIIDPASGSPLIPSVVSFPDTGGRLVGRAARARKAFDPAHTVSSVKRLLGRPYKSEEVRRARTRVAFDLKEGADSAVLVQTRGGAFSLPEVSAMVLREVRRVAEESIGQRVERCVVTVPANFNELQRSSTKIAGKIAELDVVRILNEPTAAALAYGYGRNTREKICIYDFGGGTFDVTLLELNGNVFEVLSTWGDTFLGGDDVDLAITDWLLPHLLRATRIDGAQDRLAFDILRDAAEAAKCALSQREMTRVEFNYAPPGGAGPVRFEHPFTRGDLDRLASPFVEKTFSVCQEALKLAGLRPTDLTGVILVGGSTRIPGLHGRVAQFFGRDPLTHLPPEEVVGLGAAILAEALTPGARRGRQTPVPLGSAPGVPPIAPTASPSVAPPSPLPVSNLRGSTLTGSGAQPPATPRAAPPPVPSARSTALGMPPRQSANPAIPGTLGAPPAAPISFDLDDPFKDDATAARPAPAELSHKPTPLPHAQAGLTELDEPSFGNVFSEESVTKAVFDQPVSAFNIEDDSVMTPVPTPATVAAAARHDPDLPQTVTLDLPEVAPALPAVAPALPSAVSSAAALPSPISTAKPPLGAPPRPQPSSPGLPSALASLPPALAAAIRPPPSKTTLPEVTPPPDDETTRAHPVPTEVSVPSFRLDASLFGNEPPSTTPLGDLSVPSFRLDTDDIFGGAAEPGSGTLVAKSPFEPSRPDIPAAPPGPPPPARGASVDEPTRVRPAVTQDDSELPPLVVPAPVKTNVDSIRPSPPRSPAPSAGAAIGRVGLISTPVVVSDVTKPALPSGRAVAPGAAVAPPAPSASVAPPSPGASIAPPAPGGTNAAGIAVPLLLDVTPLSLGVETAGGQCEMVIRRNATIPVEQSRVFATTNDQQTSVIIRIAQGESRKFSENQSLGELELTGLRPAPRGEVSIAVTFELGADGTLGVRAKDVETNREQATRISLLTLPSESSQAEMAARQRPTATA
jgi:molecular chaperone DnaK